MAEQSRRATWAPAQPGGIDRSLTGAVGELKTRMRASIDANALADVAPTPAAPSLPAAPPEKKGGDSFDAALRKCRVKKNKQKGENIFAGYVKDHSKDSESDALGIRSLNVRRHWRSESDLSRWHQELTANSRHKRLLLDVDAASPGFNESQQELVQQHNALFRQRALAQEEKPRASGRKNIEEVKKMADVLVPKMKVKKKKAIIEKFEFLGGLSLALGKSTSPDEFLEGDNAEEEAAKAAAEEAERLAKEKEAADNNGFEGWYAALMQDKENGAEDDVPVDGSVALGSFAGASDTKDGSPLWPRELKSTNAQMASTSMGFFPAKASSSKESMAASSRSFRPATGQRTGPLPNVLPQTCSLLLYRNGDQNHAGKVVFLGRKPKDMKDLLTKCGEGLRPSVPPAEGLYDANLNLVTDLKDIEGGGVFLLKGKEATNPPPAFFCSSKPSGGSLKKLSTFQSSGLAHAPPKSAAGRITDSNLPSVGGPCSSSLASGHSSSRSGMATWGISENLAFQLSYGGQVGLWSGRHHDYSTWGRLSHRGSASVPALTTQ